MEVMTRSARPFGWSSRLQTIAVMTSAMTYGAKKTRRRIARPRNRRFSISARPSANGIWMASESATMNALWVTDPRNTGSASARAKLARPTNWSMASRPFQSYRLYLAAWTIGNRTNTVYRASAGSRNSPATAHARRCRLMRVGEPTAVATSITQ